MADSSWRRRQWATFVWWCGLAIATAMLTHDLGIIDWSALPPETPFDGTRSGHAEQWRFLAAAAEVVPAGASFTVRAQRADTEMSLYMMAVGLLPRSCAVPHTYYGRRVAASATARFVLSFGKPADRIAPREHTVELPGGLAADRESAAP